MRGHSAYHRPSLEATGPEGERQDRTNGQKRAKKKRKKGQGTTGKGNKKGKGRGGGTATEQVKLSRTSEKVFQ